MAEPRYPYVKVKLTGIDGNAFIIIGAVNRALRKARVPDGERDRFFAEAMSGDYENLLRTCGRWVAVS